MPKPGDGRDVCFAILAEHHLSIVDCVKNLEGALPALRNMLEQFLQKHQAPSVDVLLATLRKIRFFLFNHTRIQPI